MTVATEVTGAGRPVSAGGSGTDAGAGRQAVVGVALRRMARALLSGLIFAVLGLLLWEGLVRASGITPYIAKTPGDVYHYLFTDPLAAAHRAALNHAFWTMARDATVGFFAGTLAGLLLANLFAIRPASSHAVMPVAMALRTVPLVAMVPLIELIFGNGIMGVAVIAGIVTFFPTLVNVNLALRSVPQESFDLMHGYGATRFTTLRKVQFPGALPALFASARIAAPLALVGALLFEWLSTNASGMGFLMLTSSQQGDYAMVWSAVVLTVVASVVLYSIISGIEALVLARYAPGQNRRVI